MRKKIRNKLRSILFLILIVLTSAMVVPLSLAAYSKTEFYEEFTEKEPKLDPELEAMLAQGNLNTFVTVIIVFKDQPLHAISEEVKKKYLPLLDEQEKRTENIHKQLRDKYLIDKGYGKYVKYEDPSSFCNYEAQMLSEKDGQTIKGSLEAIEKIQSNMRKEIRNRIANKVDQANFVGWIQSLGGRIKAQYIAFNAISANIALKHVRSIANHPEVARVIKDRLLSLSLDHSADTIRAYDWWDLGYDGGIWDVCIIDSGIDKTHPALESHFEGLLEQQYEKSWVPGEDADDYYGHGTPVAGIVASTDETYKGVAYGLDKILNAKVTNRSGYAHWSDVMSAVDWALFEIIDDADVINLSAGMNPGSEDSYLARFFDAVVDNLGVPVAISAGNAGIDGVEEPGVAYNILCVAASDDKGTTWRTDDTLCDFSSRGPTELGRNKPDITAPGFDIKTTLHDWEEGFGTYRDFGNKRGTSVACPHITAAYLLLMDYGIYDPMVMKALLINTATKKDFWGWDSGWGWGYVDLGHACFHRSDTFTATIDDEEGNDFAFYKGHMFPGDTATLVWNRHAEYPNGPHNVTVYYPISNIHLVLMREVDGGVIGTSREAGENVQQVRAAYQDDVIVKIEAHGPFAQGIDTEDVALATEEGFEAVLPPSFDISEDEYMAPVGQCFGFDSIIENTGELMAHNVQATLNLPAGFTLISGSNPQDLGHMLPGSTKTAHWDVRADYHGSHLAWVFAESNCYDETFRSARGYLVEGNSAPDKPRTPSGDTSGYTGVSYTYNTSTNDPDGDYVYYKFDWDDGSTKEIGPCPSGANVSTTHIWSFGGVYNVTVQAKDYSGAWSAPSDILAVEIEKTGDSGGGGGGGTPVFDVICPRLFVWNGSDYAEDFIFDLHGDSDVTMCRTIEQSLVPESDHYLLSLRELGDTTSYVDYVKLYAVDAEGVMHECHLALAVHSELGNVKQILQCNDDERITLGPSQTIDFKFNMPEVENIDYFIFEIQGYEPN